MSNAHEALLDLKRVVEEAARPTHSVELEAVHLTVSSSKTGDISSRVRAVLEQLASSDFEVTLAKARQSLEMAMS
ncbi:MAG TPA: hypothetical protein VNO32_57940 [Candidatus Acidoferrum sp.]|nr:hypothetical protein [Candidatus Acidoferrum sp.]